MEVVILGSGSYQPDLKRHASGYLVKIGKENLVFDFGRGTIDQLLKLGITYKDIDRIFITHIHADHTSDLIPFFHIAFCAPRNNGHRKKNLAIYGPKGFKKFFRDLTKIYYSFKNFQRVPYKFEIKEMDEGKISEKNWLIKSVPVEHSSKIRSIAFQIESGKKVLAYSGDTGDCPGIYRAVKNADLAIIEASWPKTNPGEHLSASQAAQIAQKSRVKKLVLTHPSPYYERNFDIKKEAQRYFKGPIILAEDLMKIKI